jgi:hypothetical protein
MFIIQQHDNVTWSGRKTRVDKDLANGTTCLDMAVLWVIESFSTQYFTFKITFRPAAIPQARSLQNAFEVVRHTRISFVVLPPRLDHTRMYHLLLWGWVIRMHWNCMWKSNVRVNRAIPLVLRPLNTRLENALEYEMVDVNDYMGDISRSQRYMYLLLLQQGMSVPIFHYTWTWGGIVEKVSTPTLYGGYHH